MQYHVLDSIRFSWMVVFSPLVGKVKAVDRDFVLLGFFLPFIIFFSTPPYNEALGTHPVTMGRKSHLEDLVSFSVGLGDVFVVYDVNSVMWQGMDRQERDPFLVFLCFLQPRPYNSVPAIHSP